MIKEKSIVLVKIYGQSFVLMTDKISENEKTKITEIADRLDVFYPKISERTSLELFDILKNVISEELWIDTSGIKVDLEVNINKDDFAPPKEQENSKDAKHFTDKGDNWLEGTIDGHTVKAKVYSEPSQYGIDGGVVSKLHITDKGGKEIISYDRGWDVSPMYEHKEIYEKVIKELVIQRLEMNVKDQKNDKRKQSSQER